MGFSFRLFAVPALMCVCGMLCLAQDSNFEAELGVGILAVENGEFTKSLAHLEKAVLLKPESVTAHLYLGQAYILMYRPEVLTDSKIGYAENERWRNLAIHEFERVLVLDPSNTEALHRLANIYQFDKKWDEAGALYRRALKADPRNFAALYSLGVIDWTRSFIRIASTRSELKLKAKQKLIGRQECSDVRLRTLPQIDEGISLLTKAVQVQDVLEPAAYMSLLYQLRADIQCGNKAAYEQDIASARSWSDRACEAVKRRKRAELTSYYPPVLPPPPTGHCKK